MVRAAFALGLVLCLSSLFAQAPPDKQDAAQSFEVATIKLAALDQPGRYITMQGTNRFVAKFYTLKLMIAAAYNLSPKEIMGGPEWADADHYDILALTPGAARPTHDEQMAMLRTLLAARFKLSFHREAKEFSIYRLEVSKTGSKLKQSAAAPGDPAQLISTVYPQRIHLPARNATMGDFASLLQRALLDRPVVDSTDLTGRYDFDLDWAPDETQFGGEVPVAPQDAQAPPFFTAIKDQLGLELVATRGNVQALVIDHAETPSAN
ncbi:MAG: TIGR03435 family protein [Terracidiphilus sp.]